MNEVANSQPAEDVILRRAQPQDQALINTLVREARLDPSSLHWSHFVIAELPTEGSQQTGRVVGIGQIRPYRNCLELGSLYVSKPYRRQGVGTQIVQALLASHPAPIYLECLDYNTRYYRRFGFYEIPWHRAPWPLCLKSGLGALASRLGLIGVHRVVVMRWDGYGGTKRPNSL